MRFNRKRWLRALAVSAIAFAGSASLTWSLRGTMQGNPDADSEPSVSVSLLSRGQFVYQTNCANCHGVDGHGDGPSAEGLNPAPRDFAGPHWKFGASPDAIRRVVADGVPGTAMPAAAALSAGDLDAVVAFVHFLARAPLPRAAAHVRFDSLLRRAGFTPTGSLRPAPVLDVRNAATGKDVTWPDLRGQLVLLNFWGVECPHCLKEFPALERLALHWQKSGLTVLSICTDEDDAMSAREVARQHAKTLPIFVDPKGLTRLRYAVQSLPSAVLVDRDGRVLGNAQGVLNWSGEDTAELIAAALESAAR